jgi:hypothetical protein
MNARARKRRTLAAMRSCPVVTIRVPVGITAWEVRQRLEKLLQSPWRVTYMPVPEAA